MAASKSSDDVVFDYRTLRLIVGAVAFAFPSVVVALTGKVTTSISASYHELQTRDVFVGFLFIIGALLISYKGHLQGEPKEESENPWKWLFSFRWVKVYQEDVISTIGGFAAIFTALYPTACDGCRMDTRAVIHMTGAFILFSTVVYFSLVAFLRSVNEKLLEENPDFMGIVDAVRSIRSWQDVHSARELAYRLFPTISIFLGIAKQLSKYYDEDNAEQIARALPDAPSKPGKLKFMWLAYGKKITRGYVYLICGSLIALTLLVYILLSLINSERVAQSVTTFVVETISLGLFGIAWMTASKLEYLTQIEGWLESRSKKRTAQPEAA